MSLYVIYLLFEIEEISRFLGVCVAHTYHHLAPSTPGKDIMTQDVQCALVTDAAADQVHLSKVVIVA